MKKKQSFRSLDSPPEKNQIGASAATFMDLEDDVYSHIVMEGIWIPFFACVRVLRNFKIIHLVNQTQHMTLPRRLQIAQIMDLSYLKVMTIHRV